MPAQPTVLVHRELHAPQPDVVTSERQPACSTIRDAVVGPISYDVASLMRDAFVSWEEPQIIDWVARYWDQARKTGLPVREELLGVLSGVRMDGLQRHLKVLGIFARN